MSTSPMQLPHPWSCDALLPKSQMYSEQMHCFTHDDWRFVLWSTLSLELLARAALAHVSPTLLADAKTDWRNILYALERTPTTPKFSPRSIDITEVIKRLQEMLPNLTPELANFSIVHMGRRNEELHSGASPLDNLKSSGWLPLFYRSSQVFLESIGETLETYLGRTTATAALEMITASFDESAKAVAKAISDHRTAWHIKDQDEMSRLAAQSSVWATRFDGHRVKCPSCGCDAVVVGKAIAASTRTIDGDDITEVQQYLPVRFECVACGLKISGLPQLSAAGLGDAYKATFTFDAADYYAPDDNYAEYEPDFNEP